MGNDQSCLAQRTKKGTDWSLHRNAIRPEILSVWQNKGHLDQEGTDHKLIFTWN